MKLKQKITCICLAAVSLLPSVGAMKSSISMPENMNLYDYREEKDPKDSPYYLWQTCDHIIREHPYTPLDKTIGDTTDLCFKIFTKMHDFLCYKEVPSDCFYVAGLSNYIEILGRINYILFNIILQTSDNMKQYFTPSPLTTVTLCKSITMVSAVIEQYEHIFHVELSESHSPRSKTKEIYQLICTTWEGLHRISNLNSFR